MRCEREGGSATLIVNEYTPASYEPAERVGYVLVFSRAEYDKIKDNLEATIIDGENLVYRYEQSNLVLQFTQKEVKSGGDELSITAVDGQSYDPIECVSYTGGDADYFKSEYGVTGIFEIKQPAKASTVAKMPFNWSDVVCYYFESEQKASGVIEPISETDITIYTEAASGKDVFLIVSDESGNKLMLIVRITNAGSGGGDDSVFTVTDGTGMSQPVTCTTYSSGAFGGGSWIMNELGVTDLFEITKPLKSMNVAFIASNIFGYECYDTDSFSKFDVEDSISDMGDNTLNVWLGEGTLITKSILLVIEGEDGNKHGLFIHVNP